ncbi:hypothetical protein M5248_003622, partial [Escherichia coli]|nr:hypothetical protein [Escherichia coli]
MKTFFLHAEIEDDRELLLSVLTEKFHNGYFKHFEITYIADDDYTRIDIS